MKVQINGRENYTTFALRDRLALEEDECVEKSDVQLSSIAFEGAPLAGETVQAVYGHIPAILAERPYHLMKVFHNGAFCEQLVCGIPFTGSMAEGMGLPVPMGGGVYFPRASQANTLFDNQNLIEIVSNMGWSGVVSLEMNGSDVQKIHIGAPSYLAYALHECWPSTLADFAKDPTRRFRERFSFASLLTCFPFPAILETQEKIQVSGLIRQIRKHFWAFAPNGVMKEGFKTDMSILGIVTAWDWRWKDAAGRLEIPSSNIKVIMKQYRRDFLSTLWGRISEITPFL